MRRMVLLTAILLSSCNVGKPYERPESEVPCAWKGPTTDVPVVEDVDVWWEVFDDSALNELETQALGNNRSIQAAFYRLRQARGLARATGADLYPEVILAPSYFSQGSLIENPFPDRKDYRYHQIKYALPFDAIYEVDLWGKLHNAYDASLANAEASQQALYTMQLSVTAEVAMSYFRLRALDTQLEALQRGISLRQNAVEVNRSRYNGGLINYADVTRAQVELSNTKAESADVTRQRAIQENILAVLSGVPASEFCLEPSPLYGLPPTIPAGIPSDLLCQRPDIAEAERTMASLHAQIGVAYASLFPSFTLTGCLGATSPDISQLLAWKARLWSIGANVAQSIFDAGRNRANIGIAKAQYMESLCQYEERVLVAFREVEDALANIYELDKQANELHTAAQAAQETTDLSQERYNKGLMNYLDVVDAERSLLDAQRNAAKVRGDQYISTVLLVKALGGGLGA